MYVALTRPEDYLFITYSSRYEFIVDIDWRRDTYRKW
jgi:superfamily I DNA/RNA helicase